MLSGQFRMDLPAPGILAVMAGASLGERQTGKMSVQGLLSVSVFLSASNYPWSCWKIQHHSLQCFEP